MDYFRVNFKNIICHGRVIEEACMFLTPGNNIGTVDRTISQNRKSLYHRPDIIRIDVKSSRTASFLQTRSIGSHNRHPNRKSLKDWNPETLVTARICCDFGSGNNGRQIDKRKILEKGYPVIESQSVYQLFDMRHITIVIPTDSHKMQF